jgi:phosphoribosylglycinamide formyltransferase-1
MQKTRLGVFASGNGSNAVSLITYFSKHPRIEIGCVVCNRPDAPVVNRVKELGIQCVVIDNEQAKDAQFLVDLCNNEELDVIVLAGYLRQIPAKFIAHYTNKIINIHPSLLPKYGGAGMYGDHVHRAVLMNNESTSGITIHLVNEEYDEGRILAQFTQAIPDGMTLEQLKASIHKLERVYFPIVVEQTLLNGFL